MPKFSVYVFLDNKNRPYYVGKTNNMKRRRKEHMAEIKNNNPLPKYAAARKLIRRGFSFKMRAIKIVYNENEAYRLERYFIKKYRQSGYKLFNCTYGGPAEIPMKINNPRKVKQVGIKLPVTKKKTTKKFKAKKVVKARRKR